MMTGSLWRDVVAELRADYRCILPTLPLGAHRTADAPGRRPVDARHRARSSASCWRSSTCATPRSRSTTGAAPLLLASNGGGERIGRLVLTSCEAFDNVPPGLPAEWLGLAAKLPGGLNAALQPMRLRPLRRSPLTFGWMSKRPIPNEVVDTLARARR